MPSSIDDTRLRTGLLVLSVLIVAYSLLIAQQILLGFLIITAMWGIYLFYHLVLVLARIASALEEMTLQRVDGGYDTGAVDRTDATGTAEDRAREEHD